MFVIPMDNGLSYLVGVSRKRDSAPCPEFRTGQDCPLTDSSQNV
jgi:hypothetical protein